MVRESEVREGEITVDTPPARDAALFYIGRIRTPWKSRLETPRQGRLDGPAILGRKKECGAIVVIACINDGSLIKQETPAL